MPGLVPGIHVFLPAKKNVDGRDEPGHDDAETGVPTFAGVICDSLAASGAR
jgi:hypothetical protein